MFNLRLCNAATIRYSLLKFGHMHLCGKDYKYFSPHCFGCVCSVMPTVMDGFFPYLAQMITSLRRCVVHNDLDLGCDLDLGFSRSNFSIVLSQEWQGQLMWNKNDVNRLVAEPTVWPWPLTTHMALIMDFLGQILKYKCNCISGIGAPIDIEQVGHQSFNHDHDCDYWWPRWGVRIYWTVTGVI